MTSTEWKSGVEVEPQLARRVRPGWMLLIDESLWAVDDAKVAIDSEGRRVAELHIRNVIDGARRTVHDKPTTIVYKVVAGGEG